MNFICSRDSEGLCDLHTHSVFSDGTYTPAELVFSAKQKGLVIALCDHNTVSGLPDFNAEAESLGVEVVSGVELSSEYSGNELHILGLFISQKHYGDITDFLEISVRLKDESNARLVDRLNKAGYSLDYEKIKQSTPNGQVNRAHIAAALLDKGCVASIDEAFKTVLATKNGFYIPPKKPKSTEVISFIREIGAVPVLAHPLVSLSGRELARALPDLKQSGLLAMETMYSLYDDKATEEAKRLASAFNLYESGGSDFHGGAKPDILLGRGKGNLSISASIYYTLKSLSQQL